MEKIDLNNKTILVTGGAGFIGSNLIKRLFADTKGTTIVNIDNLNAYYDVSLKEYRLEELSKGQAAKPDIKYVFVKGDISDKATIDGLFEQYHPQVVVNLAAQAGVRYSIENPDAYIMSNMIGFYNILEACRHNPVEHLVYASSSSVYGGNKKVPFSTDDRVDNPVSLYAATKKSNELFAYGHNEDGWRQADTIAVKPGTPVTFAPHPMNGRWSWTGPNGFRSNERHNQLFDFNEKMEGDYIGTYTNEAGCREQLVITLKLRK